MQRNGNVIFITIGLVLLASALHAGPDFERYMDWARALASGDIFELRSQTITASGVPLSQWSLGPGLLFSLPLSLPAMPWADASIAKVAALGTGWLGAIAFLWALGLVLHQVTGGDRILTVFGLGLGLSATQLGFYSVEIASESFGLTFAALLALGVCRSAREADITSLLLVGLSAGLLVLTRPHFVIYAVPAAMWVGLAVLNEDGSTWGWSRKLLAGAALALPGLVWVGVQAWSNALMTGEYLAAPTQFGDEDFRSLDWRDPDFVSVLVHPWKGALVQHPVYVLCTIAFVVALGRVKGVWVRTGLALLGVAVVIHLWTHAAWYGWWLSARSLGIRGLAPAGIVGVVLVTWVVARYQAERTWFARILLNTWLALLALSAVWATALNWYGAHSFITYEHVWLGVKAAVASPAAWPRLPITLVLGVVIWLRTVRRETSSPLLLPAVLVVLVVLGLDYLLIRARTLHFPAGLADGWPLLVSEVLSAALLLAAVRLIGGWVNAPQPRESRSMRPERLVVTVLLVASVWAVAVAGNLMVNVEGAEAPRSAEGAWRWRGGFDREAVAAAYREYQRLPGYAEEKQALRAFLLRQRVPPKELPPNW